jgi:hypothetical protein
MPGSRQLGDGATRFTALGREVMTGPERGAAALSRLHRCPSWLVGGMLGIL